jgi:hypothetical protein
MANESFRQFVRRKAGGYGTESPKEDDGEKTKEEWKTKGQTGPKSWDTQNQGRLAQSHSEITLEKEATRRVAGIVLSLFTRRKEPNPCVKSILPSENYELGADFLDDFEYVRTEENGLATCTQFLNEVLEHERGGYVEPGHRFV